MVVSENVMVPMRDGVRLATDIYRPADKDGNPCSGQFPVILGRTSYDKSNPVIWVDAVARPFVYNGYVVILQDLRGRGLSEGTGEYFHTANQKEGLDTVLPNKGGSDGDVTTDGTHVNCFGDHTSNPLLLRAGVNLKTMEQPSLCCRLQGVWRSQGVLPAAY